MMSEQEDLEVECPVCRRATSHAIVHAQKGVGREGTELTLRCLECSHVHKRAFVEEKLTDVQYVLSSEGTSVRGTTKLFMDEIVRTGEEIYLGDARSLVTAIETANGRSREAAGSDIRTIWAKSTTRKLVRVSVNRGSTTFSMKIEAQPEEEFSIGDIIETDRGNAVITKIKTEKRMINLGSADAADIIRVYAKMMRESTGHHQRPHAERRRQ